MRNAEEIEEEALKLGLLAMDVKRYNSETREQMRAQIEVLNSRMTNTQIEDRWYTDETSEEYTDGDNNLYHELIRTLNWMRGEKGYGAPSEDA